MPLIKFINGLWNAVSTLMGFQVRSTLDGVNFSLVPIIYEKYCYSFLHSVSNANKCSEKTLHCLYFYYNFPFDMII